MRETFDPHVIYCGWPHVLCVSPTSTFLAGVFGIHPQHCRGISYQPYHSTCVKLIPSKILADLFKIFVRQKFSILPSDEKSHEHPNPQFFKVESITNGTI